MDGRRPVRRKDGTELRPQGWPTIAQAPNLKTRQSHTGYRATSVSRCPRRKKRCSHRADHCSSSFAALFLAAFQLVRRRKRQGRHLPAGRLCGWRADSSNLDLQETSAEHRCETTQAPRCECRSKFLPADLARYGWLEFAPERTLLA